MNKHKKRVDEPAWIQRDENGIFIAWVVEAEDQYVGSVELMNCPHKNCFRYIQKGVDAHVSKYDYDVYRSHAQIERYFGTEREAKEGLIAIIEDWIKGYQDDIKQIRASM